MPTTSNTIHISNTTRQSLPTLPWNKIKEDVLGSAYEISINLVGQQRAKRINQITRKKSYVPNVLSFPLTSSFGEIYLCPAVIKKEAIKQKRSSQKHLGFMYIHGLLHLKGHKHGTEMEKLEQKYLKKYKLI